MEKYGYKCHIQEKFHSHIFSEITTKVCLKDVDAEHEDDFNKTAEEEDEYVVASHPILLYKLIKQMNWFYQNVYLHKLHSVASNKGNCNSCT